MTNVTIYTRPLCPYCSNALNLLKSKGVDYTEIGAGFDAEKKREMIERANGGSTFPQIFINNQHIGGCDDMMALEHSGKLDRLLAG